VNAPDDPASPKGELPFDRPADNLGISPTGLVPARGVPAGTPLTIRLRSAISSDRASPGDPFEAVLDEPILVNGQTIISAGAVVQGKVLQAQAADYPHSSGYLRLTLTSIIDRGKPLPLETASVFVKGLREPVSIDASSQIGGDVALLANHRLTFRLTHLVQLPG
jgi:hypothetical protein